MRACTVMSLPVWVFAWSHARVWCSVTLVFGLSPLLFWTCYVVFLCDSLNKDECGMDVTSFYAEGMFFAQLATKCAWGVPWWFVHFVFTMINHFMATYWSILNLLEKRLDTTFVLEHFTNIYVSYHLNTIWFWHRHKDKFETRIHWVINEKQTTLLTDVFVLMYWSNLLYVSIFIHALQNPFHLVLLYP